MNRAGLWTSLLTLLFALWVAVRILGPNPIGKSDNGDFPKVLGPYGVWVAPEFQKDLYGYFITDYRIDPHHIWNPHIPSSELPLAACAAQISRWILPPDRFDIRVLGVLHALLATLGFCICLLPLQPLPWPRKALFTALLFLVFSDPQYVQFFSTAYMDAAAMVFLLLLFAVAWNASLNDAGTPWALLFTCFGCLFLASKLQHQLVAVPLCGFALAIFFRSRKRIWLVAPVFLLATSVFMVTHTYAGYPVEPIFSAIFFKVLPLAPEPEAALKELNRPPSEFAYNHTHAFSPGSPLNSADYRADFAQATPTRTLVSYYVHHPLVALTAMRNDFIAFSADLPLASFGTQRRIDNPKPVFRAPGFQPWSIFRRSSATLLPWHIPLLYLLVPLLCCLTRKKLLLPLAIVVSSAGILSFAVGTLLDATETSRHILVYQQATDLLYLILLYQLSSLYSPQKWKQKLT